MRPPQSRARGLLKLKAAALLPLPTRPPNTPERFSDRDADEHADTWAGTLRRAGYEVLAAADGLEAMKVLLSNEVDAVVTDAVMPHLSGQGLCRFLREHPRLKSLPVVLLSGETSAQHEGADADLYLSKPVHADELSASLARLLA